MHLFPSMTDKKSWVGVAFKIGSFSSAYETLIMGSTFGQFVHCELVIGDGMMSDVFASYHGSLGFMRSCEEYDPRLWVVLYMPLKSIKNAKALSLQLLDLQIPYNYTDLWQCCVKAMLPFESELDCTNPETWKQGVFCSQMCLLYLRFLMRVGDIEVCEQLQHHLESVHSRGCSPNMLYSILSAFIDQM